MSPKVRNAARWFLPDAPDVLAMLREQAAVTHEGAEAFARWAHGDLAASDVVRDAEHRADECKYRLVTAVREAFTTPMEPEDLFEVSRDLDEVLNGAKNTVREAQAIDVPVNGQLGKLADLIADGVGHLRAAIDAFGDDEDAANEAAARAVKSQRDLERAYRRAMVKLLESDDLRLVLGRQELYRRVTKISDEILGVADRIMYATVKET
ncbi:MAG: DUF47 family protein [Solirubrobacteraceae bacterium]|jgi:hypothetical protein|nr:DUF47 family protein [Solirubrobacteraceae bacterium]